MVSFNANQTTLFAQSLALGFIATLAVAVRLYARRKVTKTRTADDHLVVAAALVFWGYNAVVLDAAYHGRTGVDISTLSMDQLVIVLKEMYANALLTPLCITLSRFSVLALYFRLFSVDTRTDIALKVISGASVLWYLVTSCLLAFRCLPVEHQWDPLAQDNCLDLQTIFVSCESVNCFLDVILVCLPIQLIRTLRLPLRDKLGLCVVFLCGGIVAISSIIRIAFTYNPNDPSVTFTQTEFWTTVQLFFGVLCACLPCYKSLFPTLTLRFASAFTSFSSRSRSRSRGLSASDPEQSKSPTALVHKPWQNSNNSSRDKVDDVILTEVRVGEISSMDRDYLEGSITVRNSIEIV